MEIDTENKYIKLNVGKSISVAENSPRAVRKQVLEAFKTREK